MDKNKICITFAGPVGSSKTPITNFLSPKLNLSVFNNDAIRSEVIEDLGFLDNNEHRLRRNERLKDVVESGVSFICDVSVDREWPMFRKVLLDNGYQWFVISLDLSKELLVRLYETKGYHESLGRLDELLQDHEKFLDEYSQDVSLRITDENFKERLEKSLVSITDWLSKL